MEKSIDIIELRLPMKAEYVSIARLAVSGIANRMGFDIESIEDIKVAVSEICSKYILKGSTIVENYRVVFKTSKECLEISIDSDDKSIGCLFGKDDEFAISILNALMDQVELCVKDGEQLLTMSKYLEGKI